MAVDTQILPVRTIGGIVLGVSILMVNSQEVSVLLIELPSAFGADQSMNLQRKFPVIVDRPGQGTNSSQLANQIVGRPLAHPLLGGSFPVDAVILPFHSDAPRSPPSGKAFSQIEFGDHLLDHPNMPILLVFEFLNELPHDMGLAV